MEFPTELIVAVLGIVLIDLVLSGDNAVVIGMAAHDLPPEQRRIAIILGGAGAVGLRVLFTALAAWLLQVPLLQAIGGAVLVWIAYKLLLVEEAVHERGIRQGLSLAGATQTIVVADAVMSLDNILAVAGVSHGDLALLLFGLGLSIPILLFGSALVAALMDRLPWLAYVGSGVLAWTAANMILEDRFLALHPSPAVALAFPLAVIALTLGLATLAPRLTPPRGKRGIGEKAKGVKGEKG